MPNHSIEAPMVIGKLLSHLEATSCAPPEGVSKVWYWSTRTAAKDLLSLPHKSYGWSMDTAQGREAGRAMVAR